jgi:FkbM family methyltransferase
MHTEGAREQGLGPEQTFAGSSLLRHVKAVRQWVNATEAGSILDYGAGKGFQYRPQKIVVDGRHVADGVAEYWDVDEVRCYDPAYAPHSALPEGRYDGVVCTDVLEHCPDEDLDWIVDELFRFAKRFVYANVACFPAMKTLPNGANAHVTVRPPPWWRALFERAARAYPDLSWELQASERAGEQFRSSIFRGGPMAKAISGASDRHAAITSTLFDGRTLRFATPNEMTRYRALSLSTKEPVTIEWLRSLPPQAAFFDIGANVGVYTIAAAVARDARVWAFEPESQNYALLNANIALNGLDRRVLAICTALSDQRALDRLYLSDLEAGTSCHSFGEEVGFDLAPRPAPFAQGCLSHRLDDLIREGFVPQPEYVKIDVDGFEHKVLHGMESALRDPRLRSLIVELNTRLPQHVEVRRWLEALGLRWDPEQVARSVRKSGTFEGVAEHVFSR